MADQKYQQTPGETSAGNTGQTTVPPAAEIPPASQPPLSPQEQFTPYNATYTQEVTPSSEPAFETPPPYSNVVVSEGGGGGGIPRWFYVVLIATVVAFFVVSGLLVTTLLKSKSSTLTIEPTPTFTQVKISPTAALPTALPTPTPDQAITKLQQVSTSDEFSDIDTDIANTDLSSITDSLGVLDREMKATTK
jgi:hypothetical protein